MKKLFFLFLFWGIALTVFSQNIQIKGVIVGGQDSEPLPGVNVVVKGTTNGTITDFDGKNFMRQIKSNQKIDDNLILEFAPKIVEGVNKLKKWSESL